MAGWAIVAVEGIGLDVGTLVASYGAATPFALVLLYWLRRESSRGDRWEGKYLELAGKMAGEVVPMLTESQRIHREAGELVTRHSATLQDTERRLRDTIDRARHEPT
jgi:hypothetical protein